MVSKKLHIQVWEVCYLVNILGEGGPVTDFGGVNVNVEPSDVITIGVVIVLPGGKVVFTVWPLPSVKVSTTLEGVTVNV